MANRRLLNSSHHVAILRHSQFKTIFIISALVSCLISINCASFGRRSVNQEWRNQPPEYNVHSGDAKDLDELLGQLSDPLLNNDQKRARQSSMDGQLALDNQQQPSEYYFTSSPSLARPISRVSEADQLYQQLVLAHLLADDQQLATPAPSQSIVDYPGSYSESALIDQPIYDTKLLELLKNNDKKLGRFSVANTELLFDDDNDPNDIDPKYIDPKLSSAIDQSQELGGDEITFGQKHDEPLRHTSDKDVYQTEESEDNIIDKKSARENHRNFTTLLEDETAIKTIKDDITIDTTATPLPEDGTTASYGTVITSTEVPQNGFSFSTLFIDMYKKLFSYLQSPSGQVNNPSEQTKLNQVKTGGVEFEKIKNLSQIVNSEKRAQLSEEIVKANTKPSVSNTLIEPAKGNANKGISVESEDTIRGSVDKQMKGRKMLPADKYELNSLLSSIMNSDSVDGEKSGGTSMNENFGNESNKLNIFRSPDNSFKVHAPVEDALKINEQMPNYGLNENKVNLMRHSNLVMPFRSSDEMVIHATSTDKHPDSLLGKYIYAPEQHYHINTDATIRKTDDLNIGAEQVYTQMSHRSYSRRLHPGDDVYGSYTGLGPMYAAQRGDETLSLLTSKTNDVYFLVMVAAFCAMAMTVVLAAGLFAYRVQQNRKSCSDTDYPTYGVVGPNNMNGKYGSASFVGGYFAGASPSSNSSVSKVGSTKHLSDIYSVTDSGLTGAGINKPSNKRMSNDQDVNNNSNNSINNNNNNNINQNRSNFMLNQNAARMYHYQHQKQQMIISDRASAGKHTSASDLDSEDENDDGSYTVYECPGLASAHEMEIKNPLFNDDQTP